MGLNPTVDVHAEGRRSDPPVSVPMDRRDEPWAIVAAAPEDDPPVDSSGDDV